MAEDAHEARRRCGTEGNGRVGSEIASSDTSGDASGGAPGGASEGVVSRRRITRRHVLRVGLGLGVAATGLGGYAHWVEPFWVRVKEVAMPLRGLPAAWAGRRIGLVSDLHVGRSDEDHLRHWLAALGDLRLDVVMVTGDFMSCAADEHLDDVLSVMRDLHRPALGVYAVLGNHDYGHGRVFWEGWVGRRLAERLEGEAGLRVLRNEAVEVDGLVIGGVDDYWQKRRYDARPVAEAIAGRTAIVMAHNPDVCDDQAWPGRARGGAIDIAGHTADVGASGDAGASDAPRHWFVCGHTHGGQCKLPFCEPPLLPVENRRYVNGVYTLSRDRRLYVNPGLGWLRQVRFAVRPEVTVFNVAAG